MKKIMLSLFFSLSLFAKCIQDPSALATALFKLDYSAILPISIGGIPVAKGRMPDSINRVVKPICICPFPPPIFIRIGIPIGYFNPDRMIDAVKAPYCFASLGISIDGVYGNAGVQGDKEGEHTFFQAHMLFFAPFEMLGILTDSVCFQAPNELDIGYMTEIDPMWNDDTLAALIQPEALLFGNPVTNLACMADSISAQADYANPALFWCKGSWGNAYPMTGRVVANDLVQSSASVAAELIYKLHRQMQMWATWGEAALCSKYPAPIWQKDAYRMQLLTPIPHPAAMAIGKTGILWSFSKNPPFKGDNFGYIIFRKKDCCAF